MTSSRRERVEKQGATTVKAPWQKERLGMALRVSGRTQHGRHGAEERKRDMKSPHKQAHAWKRLYQATGGAAVVEGCSGQ